VNAALGPIGVIPTLVAADPLGLLANIRNSWRALNSQWDQWVVGYNSDKQRQFFLQFGMGSVDWETLAVWLVIATFGIGTVISFALFVRDLPPRREASLAAWERFCRKLEAAGLTRAPSEGPLDFLDRVKKERPQLSGSAEEITRRYIEARYGDGASREELRALARLVRAFRIA
jgi:hypothetical protein